jgi:hypothetical protein
MVDYCFNNFIDIILEKERLYERNKVRSRKDLTDSQLDQEIEIYIN